MVPECSEITFSGEQAFKQGQEVVFITERAVFTLTGEGVVLTEAAPGVDIKKDIIDQMGFEPIISEICNRWIKRIFTDGVMGIHDEFMEGSF